MYNVNPETSVRYGVISMRSIDGDLQQELWHGPDAVDLSYAEAYAEAKRDAEKRFEDAREDAVIACSELAIEGSRAIDAFIERELELKLGTSDDVEFVEDELEAFSDMCQIDEPTIEGVYQGVTYRISWLGGAPLLWVIKGPIGWANNLCSPCVPNAANLDDGFDTGETADGCTVHTCYVVPRDWLAKEFA